ncbi:MAG: DUF4382 domain-containing protein [Burkholderiales bacterium]|nr:MAG: DUF4382 domain-containing protein [Burkholderiales bacterium]
MTLSTSLLRLALAASATAALLAACGGGGGGSTTADAPSVTPLSYQLQTYITDNLATEYSKVWVSLKKITAVDGAGTEVTLLDATASPVTVNLSSLAAVGQLMSTVTLPAGVYSQIKVTLGNAVQLVSLDGSKTLSARFNSTGGDQVLSIRDLDLNPANSGQLVLDFNLAKFTYDASTGIVTAVVERRDAGEAFGKFVRQQAEVHGSVTAVNTTAGTFTVKDNRLGSVVVTLAADATIVNEQTQAKLTLADLSVGANVEVKGKVTPGTTTADPSTVTASVVHVLPAASSGDGTANAPRLRGAGTVTAVSGTKVTVSLTDANFLPSSNIITVTIDAARFTHGQASDVIVGASVRFAGKTTGAGTTTIAATVFDVDGAASNGGNGDGKFNPGVVGKVATVASSTSFTISVTAATTNVPAGTYTVDASKAEFESGTASCLVVGAQVKLRGTLNGTTLTATRIEIDGCGGQKHSSPGRG